VLQCVAVCCSHTRYTWDTQLSVLQCVAVCCSVLQCVAVCCSVLQCVAVCCSVLQCVAATQDTPETHSWMRSKRHTDELVEQFNEWLVIEWVKTHECMCLNSWWRRIHVNAPWHADECVMARRRMSDSFSLPDESWHIDGWVTACRWMSHGMQMNASLVS